MLHRLRLVALIPALLLASPVLAEDVVDSSAPVATSKGSIPAPIEVATQAQATSQPSRQASSAPMSTDDQIEAYLSDLPPVGPPSVIDGYGPYIPYDDRRPHTEVGVSIGNHGYRGLYARQTTPVGKTGTLDVAVQHDTFKGPGGGRNSMTGLAVSLDFSRRGDVCAADPQPWRRDRTPADCARRIQADELNR